MNQIVRHTVRHEKPGEAAARESLLDRAYGDARFTKTSHRLREHRLPCLSLVAVEGQQLVGTVRLWHVCAGPGRPALLLGPLAVDAGSRKRGLGAELMRRAINEARRLGHGAVLLMGDVAYYGQFGFSAAATGRLWMPGPYEQHRLLALELTPGALDGARGLIAATGAGESRPNIAALIAALSQAA